MCVKAIVLKSDTASSTTGQLTRTVPCGKCPECAKARVNSWLFRIQKELEDSSNPLFITLTYDETHVPKTPNGLLTLDKTDVQKFFKRLRKRYAKQSDKQIRYYAVGEYGSNTKRPHYHAILFNLDDPDLVHLAWGLGFTYTPMVRNGAINYVLKYISKPKTPPLPGDDRLKEFSLMSKEWVPRT